MYFIFLCYPLPFATCLGLSKGKNDLVLFLHKIQIHKVLLYLPVDQIRYSLTKTFSARLASERSFSAVNPFVVLKRRKFLEGPAASWAIKRGQIRRPWRRKGRTRMQLTLVLCLAYRPSQLRYKNFTQWWVVLTRCTVFHRCGRACACGTIVGRWKLCRTNDRHTGFLLKIIFQRTTCMSK